MENPSRTSNKYSGFYYFSLYLGLATKSLVRFVLILPKLVISLFSSSEPKDIRGELALVTGGANGFGRELAIQLAKCGCNLAIVDIDFNGATDTANYIGEEYGVKVKAYKVDVANFDEVEDLKSKIDIDLGSVDILVNNAGIISFKSTIKDDSPKRIEEIIRVNLLAHIWTTKVFINDMKKRKHGHIVAISSSTGLWAIPVNLAYTATKFAVRGFMDGLYNDLVISGLNKFIKLTTIYPAFMTTNNSITDFIDENISKVLPSIDPIDAAKETINAIRKNQRTLSIPRVISLLGKIDVMEILPTLIYNSFSRDLGKTLQLETKDLLI